MSGQSAPASQVPAMNSWQHRPAIAGTSRAPQRAAALAFPQPQTSHAPAAARWPTQFAGLAALLGAQPYRGAAQLALVSSRPPLRMLDAGAPPP
jgi:hypothetical protein